MPTLAQALLLLLVFAVTAAPERAAGASSYSRNTPERAESPQPRAQVTTILDGDTFLTKDAGRVRIIGVDTPELGREGKPDEPLAQVARNTLRALILGRTVTLVGDGRATDHYGRRLAHVQLANGEDVGALLVKEGLAMAYVDDPPNSRARDYIALEEKARREGKGLWAGGGNKLIHQAEARNHQGCYCLVRGLVVNASMTQDWVFLNFGKDYTKDFTISISRLNWRQNFQPGPDPVELFAGKAVEVRGRIRDHDGPMIEVEHPLQMRVKK